MIKNVLTTLFTLITIVAVAQPKMNSPYTRYGLGDLAPRHLAVQTGRGGLTTAFNDPFHLNLANPASFAYLRTTTLETGLFAIAFPGKYSLLEDEFHRSERFIILVSIGAQIGLHPNGFSGCVQTRICTHDQDHGAA